MTVSPAREASPKCNKAERHSQHRTATRTTTDEGTTVEI